MQNPQTFVFRLDTEIHPPRKTRRILGGHKLYQLSIQGCEAAEIKSSKLVELQPAAVPLRAGIWGCAFGRRLTL